MKWLFVAAVLLLGFAACQSRSALTHKQQRQVMEAKMRANRQTEEHRPQLEALRERMRENQPRFEAMRKRLQQRAAQANQN